MREMADSEATSKEMTDLVYSVEQEGQSHFSLGPSSANTMPTLLSVLLAPQPSVMMWPRQVKCIIIHLSGRSDTYKRQAISSPSHTSSN